MTRRVTAGGGRGAREPRSTVARRPCKQNTYPLDERNGKLGWGHERVETMNLTTEDAVDDCLFNETIWRAVRGADQPMPAPRRAAFVRVLGDG